MDGKVVLRDMDSVTVSSDAGNGAVAPDAPGRVSVKGPSAQTVSARAPSDGSAVSVKGGGGYSGGGRIVPYPQLPSVVRRDVDG